MHHSIDLCRRQADGGYTSQDAADCRHASILAHDVFKTEVAKGPVGVYC